MKRTLFLGTRWGEEGAKLVPAPGDPWYATYTYDPLHAPLSPTPTDVAPIPPLIDPAPAPTAGSQPVLSATTAPAPGVGTGPPPGPAPTAPDTGLAPPDQGGN